MTINKAKQHTCSFPIFDDALGGALVGLYVEGGLVGLRMAGGMVGLYVAGGATCLRLTIPGF